MNKKNNINISKKCDICGYPILIDEYRRGSCSYCGWNNDEVAVANPEKPVLGNFLSFNNAKRFYAEGKPLNPSFEDFLEVFRQYGEMQFEYKNRIYGVSWLNKQIYFFDIKPETSPKFYKSIDEFKDKADIDGLLLKNIWAEVVHINYLQ